MNLSSEFTSVFAKSSSISQAWARSNSISKSSLTVTVTRSTRDVDEDKSRIYLETLLFNASEGTASSLTPLGTELARVIIMDISPSGDKTAIFRQGSEDKPLIEVFHGRKSFALDLSSLHGPILGDTWFGGVSWSSDERYVVYVAQTKKVKRATCFDSSDARGTQFEYNEDWGERYVGVSSTVIAVIDTIGQSAVLVPGIDESVWTVGQPVLLQRDSGYQMAYTGWRVEPRRLGMIYCYQRPCSVFYADLSGLLAGASVEVEHRVVSEGLQLARSPRSNLDGSALAYLGHRDGFDTHGGAMQLYLWAVPEAGSVAAGPGRVVVDTVATPSLITPSPSAGPPDSLCWSFPGLYLDSLPKYCFRDNRTVICSSVWGSREVALSIDVVDGFVNKLNVFGLHASAVPASAVAAHLPAQVSKLTVSETAWNSSTDLNVTVLDVRAVEGVVLLCVSSPSQPQRVALFDLATSTTTLGPFAAATPIKACPVVASSTPSDAAAVPAVEADFEQALSWKVLSFLDAEGIPFEGILVIPKMPSSASDGTPALPSLIVVPHGGPHACMPTLFDPAIAYLCTTLQAAVLHVNYRGSTGFGCRSVSSLPGNIGVNDLADMMLMIRAVTDEAVLPIVDRSRVAVVGGSHGGFLAAHGIGQHPTAFKTAVLRNPVTNIPASVNVADIPDWCHVEALGIGSFDFQTPQATTVETLTGMWRCSPVAHINNVTAATLIVLGAKDRRVPYSQGVDFYHMLRARGVPSKLLVFPEDVHKIDRPKSEADQWIVTAEWLRTYL